MSNLMMISLCWTGLIAAVVALAVAGWRGDFVLGLLAVLVGGYCWGLLGEVMMEDDE